MKKMILFGFVFLVILMPQVCSAAIYNSTEGTTVYECGDITEAGLTYYLNTSIIDSSTSKCINISANNITLDCQGYTIDGDDSANYGIYVYRSSVQTTNITIKNCIVTDWGTANVYIRNADGNTLYNITANSGFGNGIYLRSSSNNNLTSNTANNNHNWMDSFAGIYLYSNSNNNILVSNTANNHTYMDIIGYGIYVGQSHNNTLVSNTVNKNDRGIYFSSSSNSTLTSNTANNNTEQGIQFYKHSNSIMSNNNMTNNTYNFRIYGSSSSHFNQTIYTNNFVNSKRMYYNYSISNYVYDEDSAPAAGLVYCPYCDNITIKNLNLSAENHNGILFYGTNNSKIENTTVNLNFYGIYLKSSSNNNLTSNTINENTDYGIYSRASSNNIITSNTINDNLYGVYSHTSSDNTITSNTINDNRYGIYLWSLSENNTLTSNTINYNIRGIWLDSGYNTLTSNTVTNNSFGIYLGTSSDYTTLTSNTITNNPYGLYFTLSSNNNLTSNTINNNNYGIYLSSSPDNQGTQNKLNYNLNTIIINTNLIQESTERVYAANQEISFNLTITYLNQTNCSSFNYNVSVYPDQTITAGNNSNILNVSFTPSKEGIHSVVVNVTTLPDNNTELRKYIFLVGNASSETIRYYFHENEPTHGQPKSPTFPDGGSMFSYPVTSEEVRYCDVWVQFSPDEIIKPLPIIKNISVNWWYKSGGTPYVRLETYGTYGQTGDYETQVPAASDYTWDQINFRGLNITSDYLWRFYWLNIKLKGSSPFVKSNASHPSYADFTYLYTGPKFEQFTEEAGSDIKDVKLLSAIYEDDAKDNVTLQLEGEGNFTITLNLTSSNYIVEYDGILCSDNSNCTINTNSNGIVNVTLALDSIHTLEIEIDTTAPGINITSPTNTTYAVSSIDFNLTVTDDIEVDGCWYSLNNDASNVTMSNTTASAFNATNSSITDGTYTAKFWCNDTSGNENNTEQVTFTIDTTYPLIEFGDGTAVDYANLSQNNVYVNVSVNETNLANITFSLYNDSGEVNSTTFTSATYTINWTGLADNNYSYEVNITDIAENKNSTGLRHITLDTIEPTISFGCSPSSVYTRETITCSCSATDNLDSNPSISYTTNPTTFNTGTYTTTCTATDASGNSALSSTSYIINARPEGGGPIKLPSVSHRWDKREPGKAVNMSIDKEGLDFTRIQAEVKNKVNDIRITVTKLADKPASIVHNLTSKAYQYMEIEKENINDTNIQTASIGFKVNNTWISDNNINKNKVYLYRYTTQWDKLTTTLTNEDDNYIYYSAATPGLSVFVITGEETTAVQVCTPGAKQCIGDILQQCSSDGSGWTTIETCQYGCNSTTLQCSAAPVTPPKLVCTPGAKQCVDDELRQCKSDGTAWETLETCEYGCDSATLMCKLAPVSYTWLYAAVVVIIIFILAGIVIKKGY